MSYPAYENYRVSGIEWSESIPVHWGQSAVKINYQMQLGKMLQNDSMALSDIEVSYLKAQHVNWGQVTTDGLPKMWASPSELKNYEVQNGDLLVCEGGEVGRAAILEGLNETAIIQNALHRVRGTDSGDVQFFNYLLRNIADAGWFALLCNKATIAHLTQDKLGAIQIPVPPKNEQQQIAAFLDWKTSQIDALIAKKKALLHKLKEKRLAVITQAVTKGLNPDAPLRDSGIAWLGEVPSHWETLPIKHLLKAILDTEHKTCPYFEDGEYLVARTPNIRNGKLEVEGGKFTDAAGYKEWTARGKPLPGDILFTREAPAGEACIVPDEPPLCIGQRVVLFRTDAEKIDSRFAIYSLYGGAARTFIEMHSLGSTVAHFNMSEIAMIPMLVPPVAEQAKIADELDLATKRMDSMIDNAESAITRLTEYRSALITAATTGKIDVRNVAIPAHA